MNPVSKFLGGMCACLLLTACPPILGLYDEETCPTLRTKPPASLAAGTYELDSTSIAYLASLGLADPLPHSLYLDSLGFFTCSGFPIRKDSVLDFDTLVSTQGEWRYRWWQECWNDVLLDMGENNWRDSYGYLCSKDTNTSLLFWVGDPDGGKRARYRKVDGSKSLAGVTIKQVGEERPDALTREADKEIPTIKIQGDSARVRYLLILNCCGQYSGSVRSERDSLFLHVVNTREEVCTCNGIFEITYIVPKTKFRRAKGLGWRQHHIARK